MAFGRSDKIIRSVDSLERLLSVVVGIAITISVRKLLFDKTGNLYCWYDSANDKYILLNILLDSLPSMLAFVFSIVPFYHGMNCHLDKVYVESDLPEDKEGFLIVDFFIFFIEACLLVSLASLVGNGDRIFLVLSVLLFFDAIWAFASHGIYYGGKPGPTTMKWGWINIITFVVLLGIYYLNFYSSGSVRSWVLAVVAILRTMADYFFCWELYFPPKSESKPVKQESSKLL